MTFSNFPLLVFDIETIPDVDGWRVVHDLPDDWTAQQVAEHAFAAQREKNGSNFLPLHFQRVACIAFLLRGQGKALRVWSLPEINDPLAMQAEGDVVRRFFNGIEKQKPQLVSWNGGGFDLPVLHYRGLLHGATAAEYFNMGDREHRYNNYINRYQQRHVDLMDFLAKYNPRANAPLDQLSKLMGFPGKLGVDGGQVWDLWQQEGGLATICHYCETDVVNTYLVYTRFRRLAGEIDEQGEQDEHALLRDVLGKKNLPHWQEFIEAWDKNSARFNTSPAATPAAEQGQNPAAVSEMESTPQATPKEEAATLPANTAENSPETSNPNNAANNTANSADVPVTAVASATPGVMTEPAANTAHDWSDSGDCGEN